MRKSNLIKFFLAGTTIFFITCKNPFTESMPSNKPQGVSQEQLPLGVELTQNYPNPFNNSTIIAFRIPATMNVKIKIYSEEWEEREKLVDKGFEAGGYNVIFHAIDLPSGEYYYTMEAGGSILIRKMKCVK